MRRVSLVLMFAACGGSGDGAVLSFTAPEGPAGVSRIELVLASADSAAKTETRQRMRPGIVMQEDVVYYRQRSRVDSILGVVAVDGFEVRIEPDETVVEDETFIPFALMYDEQDALIAVGTVNDENGAPTPVIIKPGMVASYDVAVVKLARDADAAGIAVGQGHVVSCESAAGSWRSGAVWKPASGPQIRLLLPDVSEDPEATDAMLRASDLDCDTHPADSRDCDDLRTAYHPGQTETCDGDDTDCDGRRLELIQGCQIAGNTTCSTPGVSLCAEGFTDQPTNAGTCTQSAACGCALISGQRPTGCLSCALGWTGSSSGTGPGGAAPCAPGVGKVHFEQCVLPGCTVDVVGIDGQWEIKIAPEEAGPFSLRLTGITGGYFYIRAKYLDTALFSTSAPTLGGAYISSTSVAGNSTLMPINLELDDALSDCAASPTTGNNSMRCTP